MRVSRLVLCSLVVAACGEGESSGGTVREQNPSPSAEAIGSVDAPPAPDDLCDTVACCEAQLGASASSCLEITLVQGHCAVHPAPDGQACGAPGACGGGAVCKAGECTASLDAAVDCAGLDGPCAKGVCDPETGTCVAQPQDGACDDGDACTSGDTCKGGACVGTTTSCDDGDPCTPDTCDPTTGCTSGPSTCTECTADVDCPEISPCVGKLACVEGACQKIPDSAACDLLDAPACGALQCDEASGTCKVVPSGDGAACDDGDACTAGEACTQGQCSGGGPATCDDGDACTAETCDPGLGCVHTPTTGGACDDGDACTVDSVCVTGECTGTGILCDDGNPCTDDSCDPATGCTSQPLDGASCNDGNTCTADDVCTGGACVGTATACPCNSDADCADDGNLCNGVPSCGPGGTCVVSPSSVVVCLVDESPGDCEQLTCVPATGLCEVSAKPAGTPCTDGTPCTIGDACGAKGCVGTALACDDGKPCTADACDPTSGCVSTPTAGACDDGDACTVGESCAGGSCSGGAKADCDDGQECTADTCAKKSGCQHTPIAGICDDGDACTTGDACASGTCTGSKVTCPAGEGCQLAVCNPQTGCATSAKSCDDGDACTTDLCTNGACAYGPVDCDDGNSCTVDTCAATGCTSEPLDCDDGDLCTLDTCTLGKCSSAALDCDDDDACTKDVCTGSGCDHPAVDCDDGDACTVDTCLITGKCASVALNCDDGVVCTADSCQGGTCVHQTQNAECDDDNACTTDVCDPQADCVRTANTLSCSDGDSCTAGDTCKAGVCTPSSYTCGPCVGKAEGESCDDGDGDTTADMCLHGWCRGFEKHLVSGPNGGALTIDDVSMTDGGYVVLMNESVSSGDNAVTTYSLADLSLDGDVDVVTSTGATSAWSALTDGVAVGASLRTAEYTNGAWVKDGSLRSALLALNVPEVTSAALSAVWRDPVSGIAFVAGKGNNSEGAARAWLARCQNGACALDTFTYGKFSEVESPRLLTGFGGASPLAVLGCEYVANGVNTKYYSDAFRRVGQAAGTKWDVENYDTVSSDARANDLHVSAANVGFWVGSGGFLRSRTVAADGKVSWSKLSSLWATQGLGNFGGVWSDSTITLVASTATVVGSTVELQLVTHPTAVSVTTTSSWRRLGFGTFAPVDAPCIGPICSPIGVQSTKLEDVWSDGDTIVIVGWQVPSGQNSRKGLLLVRRVL